MEAADALIRLGGIASTSDLTRLTSRRSLNRALRHGHVRKVARGRYAFAGGDRDRVAAARVGGVLSHLSAARAHGWALKFPPEAPWVTVARHRRISLEDQSSMNLKYADISAAELRGGITAPVRTVIDCARWLPMDVALTVADSALRNGAVTSVELLAAARQVRGKGAAQARQIAACANGRAANPFESVLRALVIESGALIVQPQVAVLAGGREWHPDLVDERARVVLEADSWTFHATRKAHGRDCVRYNALTLAGWLVLRFTWEQVMLSPAYVLAVLAALPRKTARRTKGRANVF